VADVADRRDVDRQRARRPGDVAPGEHHPGLVCHPGEAVEQPFFSVAGRFLAVNGEDVQVFEYADAEAARAEAATVSPDGGTIGTAKPFWAAPPHFYRRDRVIVLYTGDAGRVRTPLEAVMGPQFAGR